MRSHTKTRTHRGKREESPGPSMKREKTRKQIYTDGSRLKDQVGYAVVVTKEGNLIQEKTTRISDHASVGMAILEALMLPTIEGKKEVSSIKKIAGFESGRLKKQIVERALERKGTRVNLKWIKAHVGHWGNELADQKAKEATGKPSVEKTTKRPFQEVRRLLKEEALSSWQNRWNTQETGRTTYEFFPRVSEKRTNGQHYLNQIYTGHGCEGQYQSRFHGSPDCTTSSTHDTRMRQIR